MSSTVPQVPSVGALGRQEIFDLVKVKFPKQNLTGKGITLDFLRNLLAQGESQTVSQFPDNDDAILVFLTSLDDADLANACKTNKRFRAICGNQELWRRKLNILMNYEFRAENRDFEKAYKRMKKSGTLIDAIELGDGCRRDLVELLLARGADIHVRDDLALRLAAEFGHTETVKLLIENGANIHAQDDGALRWAAEFGHTETVKLLIEKGADIHALDDDALIRAAQFGHTETVALLIEKGANVHADDDGALRGAAEFGLTETVALLIENGANINAREGEALERAKRRGYAEIVKLLSQ